MCLDASKLRALVRRGVLLAMLVELTQAPSLAAQRRQRGRRQENVSIPQVKVINEHVRKVWQESQLTPSAKATDGEWCRRVYLDVLGRVPSVDELREFTASKEADKKSRLLSKLLYDENYVEEYARNWTTIWTNVLIGRTGGTERNSLTNRDGMQKYLRDSFARNKPYDEMVFELVTATGSNTPGEQGFNGAVNFLAMKVNEEKGTQAAAATARVFLGLQVQCTQCHDHPFNEWKQRKFWEFNAFFRQSSAKRQYIRGTRDVASIELVDEDFAGEDRGPNADEAAIYYELRKGLLKVAYPVFIDGTPVGRSGYVSDVNRRLELGNLIRQSAYMDKTLVNRYWAHFLGYGFTKPIDDLGPHNLPSHPELLEYLGGQIQEHSYNLKELIRWITLSEPYSLSSKTNSSNEQDDPQLGETPKFSRFYLRQMRAEELYESLLVATKVDQTGGSYEEQERLKNQWLRQFVTAFGTDEGGESTTFNGTIPQTLMMFNGDLMANATSAARGGFLWDLAHSNLSSGKQIEYLFLAGLARRPTRDEVGVSHKLFQARVQDKWTPGKSNRGRRRASAANTADASLAALQDIWWALLNSNEFIINH